MTVNTWSSIEKFESQVKKTSNARRGYELTLIEKLLNCYLAGFRALSESKTGEISQLELAQLLLVVRSFNSLLCAYDLLQKGYYSQAIMLIRSAEEDYLTCRHCEIDQRTIDALLTGKHKLQRFQNMADAISSEFGNKWRINYGQLSEIAHPRQLAMGMIVKLKDNRLILGGDYDENHFIGTCHSLLRVAAGIYEFFVMLLGNKAEQWRKETDPTFNEAARYVEKISRTYGGNKESGISPPQ